MVINLIRIRLSHWKNSTHFKDVWKYDITAEILYSKRSQVPWIRLEKVSKFPARTGSLFIKTSQQYPPEISFPATATCMNGYTAKFEGAFLKMTKTNKSNTLNKIFKNINATKAIKYSYLPK